MVIENTLVLVYPGWSGYLAIEFKVHEDMELTPGVLVAWLLCFQNYRPLVSYSGKYNKQQSQSIEPR